MKQSLNCKGLTPPACFLLILVLLASSTLSACRGSNEPQVSTVVSVASTRTAQPVPPSVTALPQVTPTATPSVPIEPLATAARIFPHSWSPDSETLAYWTFTPEEAAVDYTYPPGTLYFLNIHTGERCQSLYSGPIAWLPDGRILVRTEEQVFRGTPCNHNFDIVTDPSLLRSVGDFNPNASLPPNGRWLAISAPLDTPNFDATTTVLDVQTGEVKDVVKWQYRAALGSLPAPLWLNNDQFLIRETIDQGPLLVTVGQGVTPVAPKLFGRSAKPECKEIPCDTFLTTTAAGMKGTSIYHIALIASDMNHLLLYHSESGKIENLPFRHLPEFSPDGRSMVLYDSMWDAQKGREIHQVRVRSVDPPDSETRLFLVQDTNPFPVAWSPDGTKLAISSSGSIRLFSIPDGLQLGIWDTGRYSTFAGPWSPNGEFLAVQGYLPDNQGEALFIVQISKE